jgi:murein DD-endopeptidase MepM/ murein hydrolase activator NlpD
VKRYTIEIITAFAALFIVALAYNYDVPPKQIKTITVDEEIIISEPPKAWGIPIDETISIDTLTIKYGQSLSDILRPKGISAVAIDRIARASKSIFDVRKIKSGNKYFIIRKDSTLIPSKMIYEETLSDYVVFDLDSSLVYTGKKEIEFQSQIAGGVIKSSLWNAFTEAGVSPILAVELSDIFAWTIDFFGIQSGDEFRVLFDALYVEGQYAGIGQIHAASITHIGQTINAYFFNNGSQVGYFDDEGNSLRKAFLKAPLNFSRISSRFSNNRYHPVLKIRRPHHGVDYAAPKGTPVYSIGDGTVVKKGYQRNGGGNYINIKHNSVYTSQYMHLKGFARGISTGTRIKQGQVIGYVGSTGLSTGPHLDFRIYKNSSAVDPLKVEAPPVEPISEENLTHFATVRDSLQTIIHSIKTTSDEEKLVIQN